MKNYKIDKFQDLEINPEIKKALKKNHLIDLTEVQKEIVPIMLKKEKDLIVIAQTGTGKTVAFGIPLLEILNNIKKKNLNQNLKNNFSNCNSPKAIILTPTRELTIQIKNELNKFSSKLNINILSIYGISSKKVVNSLSI